MKDKKESDFSCCQVIVQQFLKWKKYKCLQNSLLKSKLWLSYAAVFFSFPVLADSRGYYYTFFCPSLAIWGSITKKEGKNRNWKKEFSSGIIWQWLKRILSGSDLSFWLHAGVCCPRGYSNVVWLCCWNSWEIIPLKNPCCVLKTNIISSHTAGDF